MAHLAATLPMLLLLVCLLQHANAAANATTVEPIESTTIASTTIESITIQPIESTTIQPIESTTIQSIESTTIQPIESTTTESTIIVPIVTAASPAIEVVAAATSVTPTIAEAVTSTLKPNSTVGCSGTTLLFSNLIQTVQTHRSLNRFHADLDKLDAHLEQKAAEFAKDHKYRNLVIMMRRLLDVLNSTVTSSNYTVNETVEHVVNATASATRRPISRPVASLTIIRRPSYAVGTDAAGLYQDKLMSLWQYAYYRPWSVNANAQYKDNDKDGKDGKDGKDDDDEDDEDDFSYRNRYYSNYFYYKRRQ